MSTLLNEIDRLLTLLESYDSLSTNYNTIAAAVINPASVESLASELTAGKQAIVDAINNIGGTATTSMSMEQLATAIRETIVGNNVTAKGMVADQLTYALKLFCNNNTLYRSQLTQIIDDTVDTINIADLFKGYIGLKVIRMSSVVTITGGNNFDGCTSLEEVYMPELTTVGSNYLFTNCTALKIAFFPKLQSIAERLFQGCYSLVNVTLGHLVSMPNSALGGGTTYVDLRNITIGAETNINLYFKGWTANSAINEGQSGIDELNANIMANIVPNLYQGGGKTITFGAALYNVLTQATKDAITARGWNVASA